MIEILHFQEKAQYRFYADQIDEDTFNRLVNIDKKLSRWVVETYIKERAEAERRRNLDRWERLFWEDADQLKHYLKVYNQAKQKNLVPGRYRDIMKIESFRELKDIVIPIMQDMEREAEEEGGDATKVYDKDGWLIVVPHNEEASCKYGANTQWCTAGTRGSNFFQRYNAQGSLYIIIDRRGKRKWQFHAATQSYMDEHDNLVSIQDYLSFPDGVRRTLEKEGQTPFDKDILGMAKDVSSMDVTAWSKKYEAWFQENSYQLYDALYIQDFIDEVTVGEVISEEQRFEIMDWIMERGDIIDAASDSYSYGWDNPQYFLPNNAEPEDEDEDGEPTWSEEQREEAAQTSEQQAMDEWVSETMHEIEGVTLYRSRSEPYSEVTDIIWADMGSWKLDVAQETLYSVFKYDSEDLDQILEQMY